VKSWFQNIPEIYRNVITHYLDIGIRESNIYEKSIDWQVDVDMPRCPEGHSVLMSGMCNLVEGVSIGMYLAGIISRPLVVLMRKGEAILGPSNKTSFKIENQKELDAYKTNNLWIDDLWKSALISNSHTKTGHPIFFDNMANEFFGCDGWSKSNEALDIMKSTALTYLRKLEIMRAGGVRFHAPIEDLLKPEMIYIDEEYRYRNDKQLS